MPDLLHELRDAWRRGETTGLATVVRTLDSAPQPVGAAMVVLADGTVLGSVSGGCVEGAVYDLARDVVGDGAPRLQTYGVSDEDAWGVGLTCGGTLDVFVEPVDASTMSGLEELVGSIASDEPVALATVIEHGDQRVVGRHLVVWPDGRVLGSTGLSTGVDDAIAEDARALLEVGTSDVLAYGPGGERAGEGMGVFVRSWAPKPHLVIFGAVDFAAALAQQGHLLGYRVTVCDARPVFATAARFPDVDQVVVDWPHRWLAAQVAAGRVDRRTVLCVLTHDARFDVPVLDLALRLTGSRAPAFIGAMGSRSTHLDRHRRLLAAGLTQEQLDRLSSPIGLDLGGRTPQETAVSIAAEIVAARWGGTGARLSRASGRIHHAETHHAEARDRRP